MTLDEFLSLRTQTLDVGSGTVGAAHIPLNELRSRTHELPASSEPLFVVPSEHSGEALNFLRSLARQADLLVGTPVGEGNRLWSPTEFLVQQIETQPPGRVLDLGCGTGRDAVFLASMGWHVTAVDILPDAIQRARDLESRYSAGEPINWMVGDAASADLSGPFDLICMFRFFNRSVLVTCASLLGANGRLLVETFSPTHRARFGKPRVENIASAEAFGAFNVQSIDEGWRMGVHTLRVVATV